MLDETNPGPGHNNPPQTIEERAADLVATANRWISERPELADEDQAQKCSAFIDQLTLATKEAESIRVTEKDPHLKAAAAVDSKYNPIKTLLKTAVDLLKPALAKYLNKMELARQEEIRVAKVAADAVAAAAAKAAQDALDAAKTGGDVVGATVAAQVAMEDAREATKAAVKLEKAPVNLQSNMGARTKTLRTTYHADITDWKACLGFYWKHEAVRAAVQTLIDAEARASKGQPSPIPGVSFRAEKTL